MKKKIAFLVVSSVFIFSRNTIAALVEPDPELTYLGDTNGDQYFQADDMPAVQTYLNGNTAVYDTMQPQTPEQYWNTSDINGDRFLQADDVPDMQTVLNGNLAQKIWIAGTITQGTLPLSADQLVPVAFQLGVQADDGILGPQGRPGMNIELKVDPTSQVQDVELGGRDCPLEPVTCKVSTGITDWVNHPTEALTETGATGFSFTANEPGILRLRARIYAQFIWNIPELVVTFDIAVYGGQECSDSLDNDGDTLSDYPNDPGCRSPLDSSEFIVKEPYLQNLKQNEVTVMWETKSPANGAVFYGPTTAYGSSVAGASGVTIHEIDVTGLTTESTYHYKVESNSVSSDDGTFRTAIYPTTPFAFAAYGDTRSQPVKHLGVINAIIDSASEFVLHTGDLVNNGTIYSSWETEFFRPAAGLMNNTVMFTALGNHENQAAWYYSFFSNDTSSSGTESWYSFEYGNSYFIALNTNQTYATGSAQYNWFVNELTLAQSSQWIFVFFHHPAYSSGSHGGTAGVQTYLVPLIETYGVDMVFNGHDHIYERSYKNGVIYVVTGGGGAPLYPYGVTPNPYKIYSASAYHHCVIGIDGSDLTYEAKYNDGTVFDSFTLP